LGERRKLDNNGKWVIVSTRKKNSKGTEEKTPRERETRLSGKLRGTYLVKERVTTRVQLQLILVLLTPPLVFFFFSFPSGENL
jgi:hypothetical protein